MHGFCMPFVTELSPLASLEAARPVFLILMGLSIVAISWRLVKRVSGWPARVLMSGALLLAFGYSLILPMYEVGVLVKPSMVPFSSGADVTRMMGWEVAKAFAMNGGWLLFGLGLFLISRSPLPPRRPVNFTVVRP